MQSVVMYLSIIGHHIITIGILTSIMVPPEKPRREPRKKVPAAEDPPRASRLGDSSLAR